jgi:ribosomal protein S1
MAKAKAAVKKVSPEFEKLLDSVAFKIPQIGDVVKAKVISSSKNEVKVDIGGVMTGVVRGKELYGESEEYSNIKPGDEVEATVIELENENGEIEMSFRFAGQVKAWLGLHEAKEKGTPIIVKVLDANKGGMIVRVGSVRGFLPVSQLTPENYPRVEGGDKNKILEILKSYVNREFTVKVMDADEKEEKLIVSEKMAWEENQKEVMAKYKVGQHVKGKITAVTDFGAFVEFDEKMEGLVHISEIAWQRIDDPRDVVKVGDTVEAEIINIDGTKIFLSMKKLIADPWSRVGDKYKVGDVVKGKVLKVNPFGLFVELDPEIHGLAHISELSDKPVTDISTIAKAGQDVDFKIISLEPKDHRLGLSIKAINEPKEKKEKASEEKEVKEEKAEESEEEKETKKKPAAKKAAKKKE